MAHQPFLFNVFFFLTLVRFSIFSTPTSLVYSLRTHNQYQNQHFQVLDVSASIQKTLQVFSNEKSEQSTTSTSTNSSSVLSFSLHPRDSIIKPKHQSYSALTLARLTADSARANFINSKLRLALSSKSQDQMDILRPLKVPVTSGRGAYAAQVGVGQPVKRFHLIADTGSDINWLQCQPCKKCFPQSDPIFNPYKSTSYKPLPCQSQQCTSLRDRDCTHSNTCIYGASYGDNSRTIGNFATETLSFSRSGSVKNVAIGCGRINQGEFNGFAGIIGLGGSVVALPSQVKAKSFSYCLVDMDSHSSSTLEFNSAPPRDSVIIPLIKNPKFDVYYYVELRGIKVGGDKISVPASVYQIGKRGNGGIIVDSGTTVTQLDTKVYNSLRAAFVKHTKHLPKTGGLGGFDTCYDLSSMSKARVPKMSFRFSGGKTVSLPTKNYLIPVTSNGKFCLAFQATTEPPSIIGNIQQQGFRVTFDLANKRFGFSPNKC